MLANQKAHARLFYEFDFETHLPENHFVCAIDHFSISANYAQTSAVSIVTRAAVDRPRTHRPHARHRLDDVDQGRRHKLRAIGLDHYFAQNSGFSCRGSGTPAIASSSLAFGPGPPVLSTNMGNEIFDFGDRPDPSARAPGTSK